MNRAAAAAVAGALALAGCGGGAGGPAPDPGGSTRASSWVDRDGDGVLEVGPRVQQVERTELGPAARPGRELARLGFVTDAHVVDEESPAHLAFLDRLGPPFTSTFRPHESVQPHVLAALVRSLNALRPDAVVEGGDLADSAQSNELDQAIGVLRGGRVVTDTGARGYEGPQRSTNPDPLFYRPDADAPRVPGLLERAARPLRSPGLRAPWYPVLGNHDVLVAGEVAPTARTNALATGDRALTRIDRGLRVPREAALAPATVDRLLARGLPGRTERRSPDPDRRQLAAADVVERLRAASAAGGSGPRLDHAFDVGGRLRVIALDVVARDNGSDGRVDGTTLAFLRGQLARAGSRRVMVATHQPLRSSAGGAAAFALLDRDPRVVAVLAGHTHRNRIRPRRTPAGGYWSIETASVADFPQQARAIALVETAGGGLALSTWMVDFAPGDPEADAARRLAYLDAQGGRPAGAAGRGRARNALLQLPRPR